MDIKFAALYSQSDADSELNYFILVVGTLMLGIVYASQIKWVQVRTVCMYTVVA